MQNYKKLIGSISIITFSYAASRVLGFFREILLANWAGVSEATDTLDLFYNDIDVKGTIGQVSTTLCPNETPPAFTNDAAATATIGTIAYRWQTRTSGTNFIDTSPLVTTAVYTPTSGLTTTPFYRRVAESTFGGKTCEEFSNVIQITVNESPISGLQVGGITAPGTVAICGS